MRKFIAVAVAVCLSTIAAPKAMAQDQASSEPTASASVVRVDNHRAPARKVVRRTFRPWAKPSPRQVREIIRAESRRYGIHPSRLARRIACESGFRWYATSAYHGLLQFAAGTYYRGLRTLGNRRVKLVRTKSRRVNDTRVLHWSNGTKTRRKGTPRRQLLTVVYRGRLPRSPGLYHGWTQVRIGAQAIRGVSAVRSSEWGCPA